MKSKVFYNIKLQELGVRLGFTPDEQ